MIGSLLKVAGPRLLGAGTLKAFMAAFNHLLDQHPTAGERLAAHAGRKVRIGVAADGLPAMLPRPELWASITDQGRLTPVESGQADVELLLKPSLAAGQDFARGGVEALSSHLRVEGDVLLAGLLGELLQELRWDYEDDLARVVGDPAARRVGDAVNAGQQAVSHAAGRIRDQAGAVAREATGREDASTVTGQAFQSARSALNKLDERLSALEKKFSSRK